MSDELPQEARGLPIDAPRFVCHVGTNCVVSKMNNDWFCAFASNTGASVELSPRGGCGADSSQAMVFFRLGKEGGDSEVRVIRPDESPFRSSSKGRNANRSKSFDNSGSPVPEVLLLYALKTKCMDDRLRALSALPHHQIAEGIKPSSKYHTSSKLYGVMFRLIHEIARDGREYNLFVGRLLAKAAGHADGLADWHDWEKVADKGAEETHRRTDKLAGVTTPDFDALFIQAVKETIIDRGGLPAQVHVRERWNELGGRGEWKDNRRKLGFDWLPSLAVWRRDWVPCIPE